MGANSGIEWTDHTFNPWIGCTKVSEGCKHCYAEREMDHHWKRVQWGPQGTRVRTSAAYWREPLKWNSQVWAQCEVCGWRGEFDGGPCQGCQHPLVTVGKYARQRVFCASLADVFEDRDELKPWRDDLFRLIEQTPNLDWLILTKRPQNVTWYLPDNVWIGTSVENQRAADERIPALLKIPAKVRFLSCEPLLGKVNLRGWVNDIQWVIAGGESGPEARPMHPNWARSLRGQCQAAKVPFFFKQWGEWKPVAELYADDGPDQAAEYMEYWTAQVEPNGYVPVMSAPLGKAGGWHEFQPCPDTWFMARVGKKESGRELDGQVWNEYPRAK